MENFTAQLTTCRRLRGTPLCAQLLQTSSLSVQAFPKCLRFGECATSLFGLEICPAMVDHLALKMEDQFFLRLTLSSRLAGLGLCTIEHTRERCTAKGFRPRELSGLSSFTSREEGRTPREAIEVHLSRRSKAVTNEDPPPLTLMVS